MTPILALRSQIWPVVVEFMLATSGLSVRGCEELGCAALPPSLGDADVAAVDSTNGSLLLQNETTKTTQSLETVLSQGRHGFFSFLAIKSG